MRRTWRPRIDVYVILLDRDADRGESWRSILSAPEQDRADRFRHSQDALRFVAGRALLRTALSARLGTPPSEVRLVEEPSGRVVLAGRSGPSPHFSVAHGGNRIVVALGTLPVGVDVEPIGSSPPSPLLLARVCTRRESALLTNLEESERRSEFTRLWARKEALCKAGGASGMAQAGEIDVLDTVVGSRRKPFKWRLSDFSLEGADSYAAALAYRGWQRVHITIHDASA